MNTTGDLVAPARAKPPIRLRTLPAAKAKPATLVARAKLPSGAASKAFLSAPRVGRAKVTANTKRPLALRRSSISKAKPASKTELAELSSDFSSEASACSTMSGDSDEVEYSDSEDDEAATSDHAPQVTTKHSAVSEYEQQRLRKMQQNAAYLATLGLASTKTSLRQAANTVQAKPTRKRSPATPALPTRSYALRRRTLPGASPPRASPPSRPRHRRRRPQHDRVDAQLKKIYAMDMSTARLLATGGHLGYVSVYGADVVASGPAPLQSFRAHGANDAYVKVWDLRTAKSNDGCPKELTATNALHGSGIFSLDLAPHAHVDARLVTSSKDQSVVVSRLTPAGAIQMEARYQDHAGVVKCARFSRHDPNVFASCGNDRAVYIRDIRSPTAAPVALAELHTQSVNCVRWHPEQATQLLTAGFDGQLFLMDTRQPKAPVQTFLTSPTTRLFNPEFVTGGYIAVCLEKALTLYCTQSGAVFSRGSMAYDGDSILVTPTRSILIAHKHIVSLYASE
ncbi:hypothetical protein SPRG_07807 [Saprolegnia parasitica CBS 223.65]|uniref:Uncharacterized protein n=1 Tax=Saprolegnia parasitica (strain CBS 223.65) TaxID=695850 RepID=A0A067CKK4_SAPPC|nr:hypothetical protein SPRG_07807 [Saprolegnia parasitica CBS 223.65]KDO27096.1 hypothetical protein SPRG_07807 [Saprolegnia parasitica CBS 223.65]|eukprot:XP_012202190.1 hypothetical protein SPRG_07807 [Saprolegnia parasitica CBS 223.65]